MAQGLVARPVAEGEVVYFGLVGTNLVDNVEIIPYFATERQQYLNMIWRGYCIIWRARKTVSVTFPICRSIPRRRHYGGDARPIAAVFNLCRMADRFAIEFIAPDSVKIPNRVDMLLGASASA